MDVHRLKNVILVVLLVANIVLAAILGVRAYEQRRAEELALDNTTAALERMGMTVSRELLQNDIGALYPSEVEHDRGADPAMSGMFVSGSAVSSADDGRSYIDFGALSGEFYITDGTPSKSLSASLLALAAKLDDTGTPAGEVLSVELGWMAELASPGYTTLRPTWLVVTDAGAFYVDAMGLDVSSVQK